jgi:hypothetical protein
MIFTHYSTLFTVKEIMNIRTVVWCAALIPIDQITPLTDGVSRTSVTGAARSAGRHLVVRLHRLTAAGTAFPCKPDLQTNDRTIFCTWIFAAASM